MTGQMLDAAFAHYDATPRYVGRHRAPRARLSFVLALIGVVR